MDPPPRYGCHERAFRFHALNLGPRSTSSYGASVGFFSAAAEVTCAPSFEGDSRRETGDG